MAGFYGNIFFCVVVQFIVLGIVIFVLVFRVKGCFLFEFCGEVLVDKFVVGFGLFSCDANYWMLCEFGIISVVICLQVCGIGVFWCRVFF